MTSIAKLPLIPVAIALSGCAGAFRPASPIPVVEEEVVPVQPPTPLAETCFVRAQLFRGLVPIPCADLDKRIRP